MEASCATNGARDAVSLHRSHDLVCPRIRRSAPGTRTGGAGVGGGARANPGAAVEDGGNLLGGAGGNPTGWGGGGGRARGGEETGGIAADEVGSGTGRWDREERGDARPFGPGARATGRDVPGNKRASAGPGSIRGNIKERAGTFPRALWSGARCAARRGPRGES